MSGPTDASAPARWALPGGPLLALVLLLLADLEPGSPQVTRTAAVALLMAVWWMTEALPLGVTALLPVALFPALGIMDGRDVAPIYFNPVIFLFIGGFMVALAMQRWNLHKRIALRVLMLFGTDPRGMLLGFMLAAASLSMWISNTATTMMMVPIALAVILKLEESARGRPVRGPATALLLGVAYGASLGGIATVIGTPPNLFLEQIFANRFPGAPELSFATWMVFGLPISLVFLAVVWLLLSLLFMRGAGRLRVDRGTFREQVRALGRMSYEERVVLAAFVLLALLWLTRGDLELGAVTIPGWARLFARPAWINDGTVAVAVAVALFVIPARGPAGARILDWNTVRGLPWGIVLLFGGGFALAAGFEESGLSLWVGNRLELVQHLHPLLLIAGISLVITFLTELTSNTATSEILLPILAALSLSIGVHPLLLMIPGALSCSLAFMLPVATPPNAIIFGTGRVRVADMARAGVLLNLLGAVLIALSTWFIVRAVFGIEIGVMPDWALAP